MAKIFDAQQSGQTLYLRKFLIAQFDAMQIKSYYLEADKNAAYPYVVFDLDRIDSFDDSKESRQYAMEINAYNKGSDTVLENLLDHIESEFLGANFATDKMTLSVNPGYGRIDVQEPAPLKRKRVLFDLKYWFKEC